MENTGSVEDPMMADVAIEDLKDELIVARMSGSQIREMDTLTELGNTFQDLIPNKIALHYFQKAENIAGDTGDLLALADLFRKMGDIHLDLDEMEKVVECAEKALPIYQKIGDRIGEEHCFYHLGLAHTCLHQWEKGIKNFQRAMDFTWKSGDREGRAHYLHHLGYGYYRLGEIRRVIDILGEVLCLYEELGSSYADVVRKDLAKIKRDFIEI